MPLVPGLPRFGTGHGSPMVRRAIAQCRAAGCGVVQQTHEGFKFHLPKSTWFEEWETPAGEAAYKIFSPKTPPPHAAHTALPVRQYLRH